MPNGFFPSGRFLGLFRAFVAVPGVLFLVFCASAFAGTKSAVFQDWAVECPGGAVPCTLAQTAATEDDQLWLGTLRMQQDAQGAVDLRVLVPGSVHLGSGLFVGVRAPLSELTYQRCSPDVCVAAGRLNAEELRRWKAGTQAEIRYRPSVTAPPIVFNISLIGVTAALRHAQESGR